jgi:hypothetical protein
MLATAARELTMTTCFANTLTLSGIEVDEPRSKGWTGSGADEDSIPGGVR